MPERFRVHGLYYARRYRSALIYLYLFTMTRVEKIHIAAFHPPLQTSSLPVLTLWLPQYNIFEKENATSAVCARRRVSPLL